jgi:hypothetical protein
MEVRKNKRHTASPESPESSLTQTQGTCWYALVMLWSPGVRGCCDNGGQKGQGDDGVENWCGSKEARELSSPNSHLRATSCDRLLWPVERDPYYECSVAYLLDCKTLCTYLSRRHSTLKYYVVPYHCYGAMRCYGRNRNTMTCYGKNLTLLMHLRIFNQLR